MGKKSLMTTAFPASQEFSYFGNVLRAIMGRGSGKFSRSTGYGYSPVNNKIFLMDTSPGSLMSVAMEVPHLNTVISTGAELFSLMEIKHVDKDEKDIENSPLLKFLKRPNPLQSLEQYLYEYYVQNSVYNKTFQHKLTGLSFDKMPSGLWILPSGWMKINATGKIYRQTDIKQIIESFVMQGDSLPYEVEKIIYMAEGIGSTLLNPVSRIEALQIPLSNIVASLKSRNIITSERGMIGFMTPEPQTGNDQIPYDDDEHERTRKEYQKQYSLDGVNGHVGFTKQPMKWVPMTFDVGQLGLLEGVEDDFASIIAAWRHDRDIYPSVKGATFENKKEGMKSTIQNGLQPVADKLMNVWTENFLDPSKGEKLIASYDYLPCMKEDERIESQSKLYVIQGLSIALRDNVINHQTYAEQADLDLTGTQEKPETQPAFGNLSQPKP